MGMILTKEFVNSCRKVGVLRDFLCQAIDQVDEKDKEIAELKETLNNSRNARKYWRNEYLIEYKESLHQKYKRCLAMAMWCAAERDIFNLTPKVTKVEFFAKWHKRWLKIAEQFKEAK